MIKSLINKIDHKAADSMLVFSAVILAAAAVFGGVIAGAFLLVVFAR